jgi:hypothetical protein
MLEQSSTPATAGNRKRFGGLETLGSSNFPSTMVMIGNGFDRAGEMPHAEDLTNRINIDTRAFITHAVDMRGS